MAQLPRAGLVRGHDKPVPGSCAIYFPGGIVNLLMEHIESFLVISSHFFVVYRSSSLFLNQNHEPLDSPPVTTWRFDFDPSKAYKYGHPGGGSFGLIALSHWDTKFASRENCKRICILHASPNKTNQKLIVLYKLWGKDLRYIPVYVG